jgi:hypothetical protein
MNQPALISQNTMGTDKDVARNGSPENYTRNEWKRYEKTLETSGEEVKNTLETSVFKISNLKTSLANVPLKGHARS